MMDADRLRKEAARARREGRPVRLMPSDVETIADALDALRKANADLIAMANVARIGQLEAEGREIIATADASIAEAQREDAQEGRR